jgi:hypothetical protein
LRELYRNVGASVDGAGMIKFLLKTSKILSMTSPERLCHGGNPDEFPLGWEWDLTERENEE